MLWNRETVELCIVAFAATFLFLVLFNHKKRNVRRWGCTLLVLLYALYLSFRLTVC